MTPHDTPCMVEITAGPTKSGAVADFELFYARRALTRLKSLLGPRDIQRLLQAEIDEGNAYMRANAESSKGAFRSATTTLNVRGITAERFLDWFDGIFTDEAALLAAEPEHYVQATNPTDHVVTVIENLGPHVVHMELPAYDSAHDMPAEALDELLPESDYPTRRIAPLMLADGTLFGRMLTQFGDTSDGFNASLTIFLPTTCSEEVFEQHREHLAVEFTNWILAAADAQSAP